MLRVTSISLISLCANMALAQEIYEVQPMDLGVLTEDYSPVMLDSGFVMCSIRETGATIAFKDAETGKPLADLYWVPLKDRQPGLPVLFSANLTTPVNEGPAAFTNDGQTICFTRNQVLPKKLSNLRSGGQLGLYFADKTGSVWSNPIPFIHNSTKYSTMHPAISADGKTLFFASDMPGGSGGVDLYQSRRTADGWSAPVNLGPRVNSAGTDAFPMLGKDGTLYFASERVGGQGKLDLYSAGSDGGTWSIPAALPIPLNSAGNDLSITFSSDGWSGIMSSDRSGSDKVYLLQRTVPKFRECTPQQLNNYCYSFKAKPHAATSTLPLDHIWDLGDGTQVKGLRADHCYKDPGAFHVRSILVDRKSGAIFHTLKEHDLVVEDIQQAWITAPDTVRTGRAVQLDALRSNLPRLVAAEHHWDMGDGARLHGSMVQYTFPKAGEYEVRLDVLGIPDANGVIHNQCNTRKITVIDKFRDHEDMSVVATYQDAMGMTHSFEYQELPFDQLGMSSDHLSDVTFSVELFASKERISLDDAQFTEVRKLYRVVERFDPERGVYTYSVGEAKNMEGLYEVFKKVKELQFMNAEVHQIHIEKLLDLSKLDFASIQELNHTKLRTNAIHFAYKSAELGEGSQGVLQQVLTLLKQYPEVQLVIEAHTDDIGSRSYNIDLSQQRAQSVHAYLLNNGIEAERLIPVGHGKNQPIASNKTEEGRSLNRRVEFRMTVKGQEQAFQKTR